MPDWKKRKRVRTMRRVLREHGSPVPKKGCLGTFVLYALAAITMALVAYGYANMGRR